MSIEALWTVEFISNLQVFGSGVAVLETLRVFGGDAKYYYLGDFDVKHGEDVSVNVKITHFAGEPYSVFGPAKEFQLKLTGKLTLPIMELSGYVEGAQHLKMSVRLTKREDLP